jgi:phospholipase C
MILMENHNWSAIKGSKSATYINGTLIPAGAHAENYKSPAGLHPSEPNSIWLEAGDNLGITTDDDPDKNHRNEKDHFTTQLEAAGVSWKAYVEDIDGKSCPLASSGLFAAKHVPMLYFDDVTDTNSPTSKRCIDHIRPYTELEGDLGANKAAQYNFITPNLCNDMHGETFGTKCQAGIADMIKKGDDWLAAQIPKIQASKAYNDGGVIIIVWDEGDAGLFGPSSDGPVPMIVLSKQAKAGFASKTDFTHSSMLKTLSLIFGVKPLRGAATANDLGEMFTPGAF